ncbi:MAG: putative baseplate assembly protein [Actinobacteria bacterium]|jgi:hypothetical protein|nr:putative baseplate assembly protein [Actinomycetota bacterium]
MPDNDQLVCDDAERRRLLLGSDLNGIDYIEVPFDDQKHIRVYFVKAPVPALDPGQVSIQGGVRITGIEVLATSVVTPAGQDPYLEVTVEQAGDFSAYLLSIDAPGVLDPGYDHQRFGFKVGCPSNFDCRSAPDCPPAETPEPVIDYLAKDYASFRQLLVDMISTKVPEWTERHAADLGMALVELLAYEADHISYAQDAAAQEMHLETARQRESVRRHAKLIDYPMHHGLNAKAFVHLTVRTAGVIPARSLLAHAETTGGVSRCPERTVRFATRIGELVDPASSLPPGPVIAQAHRERALLATDAVFEPVERATVHPDLNTIWLHSWADRECCLPVGSTSVDLVGDLPLSDGDLLLLEEARGVPTGLAQDADPSHRQVVRLAGEPEYTEDPLLTAVPDQPGGVRPREAGDPPLPVTRVSWDLDDALTFPLCVSTLDEDGNPLPDVAVARGNIVLVDHGLTVKERHVPDEDQIRYSQIAYRFRLSTGPLTFGFGRDFGSTGPVAGLYHLDPRSAQPHVVVVDGDGQGFPWLPEPDLLGAGRFARSFVAEPDHEGRALIRFGDGTFGRRPSFPADPPDSTGEAEEQEHRLCAIYRVGNGRQGNVGAETIVHVIEPEAVPAGWPSITGVRNPMPAWGGVDPEPIELVKQVAPDAFRAETYRAVTEADYAAAAQLLPAVSRAQATFRWTGSWHTVFVTVDPTATDTVPDPLDMSVRNHLTRYKQAGYDLEIDPPRFVPLRITLVVCAKPDHFRHDVAQALATVLSARTLPDRSRGFFHPDHVTFGQPVHLSELYAAVERVPGVDSVEVVEFHRYGEEPAGELTAGRIDVERLEIVRLNNDPNFPEHGVLTVEMRGGK